MKIILPITLVLFFSACGGPATGFVVMRATVVLKKNARGVAAGINWGSDRGRFFQVARAFFQVILKKNGARPAGQLINDRIGTVFQVERFFRLYWKKQIPAGRPIN